MPEPTTTTTRTTEEDRKPYTLLGILVIGGIFLVIVLGALGAASPGLFDNRTAFFMTGGAIFVLALACVYLFFTLSNALRILHVHEQRIPELQASRDATQDQRIAALERGGAGGRGARAGVMEETDPQAMRAVTALTARVEDLERRLAAVGTLPPRPSGMGQVEAPPSTSMARAEPARASSPAMAPARAEPFGDVHPVVDVEGIGPAFEAKLKAQGIHDTRDLWRADAAAVAAKLGVAPPMVWQWQQMSELMAINGLGKQYSEVLVKAGVRSIGELRAAQPRDLLGRIEKASEDLTHRIQKNPVTEKVVEGWVQMARDHRP